MKPFRFDRFEEALSKYKRQRDAFLSEKSLEQADIDKMTKVSKGKDEMSSLPSSITEEKNQTLVDILDLLKNNRDKGFTAQEVADDLGISRITARRYLDEMESEDKLELYLEYGKVGRPRNKYRIHKNISGVDFE
ncbi:HTH domain-containing protein [Fusibacter sp. JL216-2]|uniref:HTH domain-containing protein n=1 Tax=Fusibacter sp. JL216-2 TaxID=3071453 RepID=UPI003D35297A